MELCINTSSLVKWAPWIQILGGIAHAPAHKAMYLAPELPAELDDEALFTRIANGDEQAFALFYDRHETLLYSIAYRIVGTEVEAEDIVQEAAVVIWERAPSYMRSLGKPVSWAIAILRNKAIDRFRSSKRRSEVFADMADGSELEVGAVCEVEPRAFGREDATLVQRALATLGAEQRHAIELAFFGGMTQSEIAERLGQPLGTIKARIRRGMLQLRDALEGAL